MATAKKPGARPTSNAAILRKLEDIDRRLTEVESVVANAKTRQQQAAAAQLAQHPEKLAALRALVDLAEQGR